MIFQFLCLSFVIGSNDNKRTFECSLELFNPKENVCFVKCIDDKENLLEFKTNLIIVKYNEIPESTPYIEENESGATSIVFEDYTDGILIGENRGTHLRCYDLNKNLKEIRIEFFFDECTKIRFLSDKEYLHYSISIINPEGNSIFKYIEDKDPFFGTNMSLVCFYLDLNSDTSLFNFRKGKTTFFRISKPVTYCDADSEEPFDDLRYDPIKIDKDLLIFYRTAKNTRIYFNCHDKRTEIYGKRY